MIILVDEFKGIFFKIFKIILLFGDGVIIIKEEFNC